MERDEEIMMRGTKQEMPGFRFRLLRPEKKRELWNPDFELLFLLRGSGRVSYEDGEVHNLPMGSIFAINRFQICDLDLDEDGLALSLCVSAETIDSFHIKLLKCEVKCQSFFYMEDQQEKFDLIRRDMARIFLEMYKNNEEQPIYMKSRVTALLEDLLHPGKRWNRAGAEGNAFSGHQTIFCSIAGKRLRWRIWRIIFI